MDWLDLLAVQGTLKSLLQHHSSKAPILWRSAFFTVQLSHSYMTTGKTIALTIRAFGGQVMSLLFNMLSRLVIRNFICIWNISIFPLVRKSKNSLNFMEIGFCQKFEIKLFFKKRSLSHFYLLFYELSGYILAKCKSHIAVLFFTNFYKLSHILKSKYLLIRGIMLNEIHLHVLSLRYLTVCRKIGWFFRNWWFHGYYSAQDRNCQICPAEKSLINLNDL